MNTNSNDLLLRKYDPWAGLGAFREVSRQSGNLSAQVIPDGPHSSQAVQGTPFTIGGRCPNRSQQLFHAKFFRVIDPQ